MNVFSILTDLETPIELSEDNYYNATKRIFPYVQKKEDKQSTYAICPECKNPIQLVNRTNKETESDTLYAKHAGRKIDYIADHNEQAYLDCSLASPQRFDSPARRSTGSVKNNELKKAIIENVDLIISIIETDIGIKLSSDTVEKMIIDFGLDKGYEYKSINLFNLPYGFAYRTEGQDLIGCRITNEKIVKEVNSLSVGFKTVSYNYIRRKKDTPYPHNKNKLCLFFANHRIHDESHDTSDKESIVMNIVEIDASSGTNVSTTLFRKTIFLNKSKFMNGVLKRERLKKLAIKALNEQHIS